MKKIVLLLIGIFTVMLCLGEVFTLYILLRYAVFYRGKLLVIILFLLIIGSFGIISYKCFTFISRNKPETTPKYEASNCSITEHSSTAEEKTGDTSHEEHATKTNSVLDSNESLNQLETVREQLNTSIEQANKMLSTGNIFEVTPKHDSVPIAEVETIQTKMPQETRAYVEYENIIRRTDEKPISDEEVPYLMQIGYEKALQKEGMYNGQLLDLSFMQTKDKNKKEYTRIPTYDELSIIEPSESDICPTDILFLKYIDGLCLERPFIAQYWYYDYNLNYSEEIKKLIATGLLTISNININKFKVEELKKILRHFNLPLTGKKHDLQERILSNISTNDLCNYLGNTVNYFCPTQKGKALIDEYTRINH